MLKPLEGAIIMILGIVITILLSLGGGLTLDHLYVSFDEAGIHDISPSWSGAVGDVNYLTNLFYIACLLPGILGIAVFAITIFWKEGIDVQYQY